MSQWEPGEPLFRPGIHQFVTPMFSIKGDDPPSVGLAWDAARWSPEKGWHNPEDGT